MRKQSLCATIFLSMSSIATQKDFLERLAALYARNVEISRKKNSDYANTSDPFQNFRACEQFGVAAPKGIIVRMTDKLMRIANLLDREPSVSDESILDTLSDLANYSMILRMYLENKKISPPTE